VDLAVFFKLGYFENLLFTYQITRCLAGYSYKLKHLETGKQMKRPMHAGRLRPHLEPGSDRLPIIR